MASGGRSINAGSAEGETRPISDEIGTESINLGSDQVFQNNCNVCLTQGNMREAVSYCTICNEYLCQGCEYSHKGSRASKDHTLLTGSSIPSGSTKKKQTVPIMFCESHKTSLLEIFCKTHDEVICSICKMGSHTECDTVDVSRHASKSNVAGTFRTVVKSLADTEEKFVNLQKSRRQDKTTMVAQIQTCLQDMRQIRHDVNVKFDELEKDMAAEIKNFEDKLSKEIDDHDAMSKNILNQISDLKESLDECHKTRDDDVIFIGIKKASAHKIEFEKIIGSIMAEVYPIDIRIEPNEILADVIDQVQSLGTLVTGEQSEPNRSVPPAVSDVTCQDTQTQPGRSVPPSLLTMTVGDQKEEIDLGSEYVCGCTFMPDGHLVIACIDGLKLFDRGLKYISKLSVPSVGVVCINESEVIVTQGVDRQLLRVKVLPTMKVKNTMKMDKDCWGVDVFDSLIYTGCTDDSRNGEIRILDMDGHTKRRLGVKLGSKLRRRLGVDNDKYMFKNPFGVKVNKDGSKLFVSDYSTNLVTCLNQQGHVIYRYSDKDLKEPSGLYVDGEDNLLVCGGISQNVHVVRHDGKREKILLSGKDGVKFPMGISYRQSDGCLAVVTSLKFIVFKTKV